MILAAGKGRRLGELGRTRAKCMLRVDGTPLIERIVSNLYTAGVRSLVVNLHHRGDEVKAHLDSLSYSDLQLAFSKEDGLLGTGGAIKNAKDHIFGCRDLLVHNGDIFWEGDLRSIIDEHQRSGADATLLVGEATENRALLFDERGYLRAWTDGESCLGGPCPEGSRLLGYRGIQILSAKFYDVMEEQGRVFSLVDTWLLALEKGFDIGSYETRQALWMDIGTPERLRRLRRTLAQRRGRS